MMGGVDDGMDDEVDDEVDDRVGRVDDVDDGMME